ncbi:MAG: InlB B-repeat-containing protein, partial [Clostridia bacterium]|nr:InlB B-repeat-containing protein [Clostridia bacterium]
NSYSNQKSFVVNGTSSSYANYYYFTCYNEGTYTFNATLTSGDYYIYVYNVTQGKNIIDNFNMYGSYSSKSATFTANAGDVLYVRLYNYSSGSTGSGTFYVSNASYPDAGGRTSMVAVYDTVNLTYDQSGFTLLVPPTKEGYVFVGWFDGVGGTGVQYTNENGVSVRKWDKEENTVLYAKWRTIY